MPDDIRGLTPPPKVQQIPGARIMNPDELAIVEGALVKRNISYTQCWGLLHQVLILNYVCTRLVARLHKNSTLSKGQISDFFKQCCKDAITELNNELLKAAVDETIKKGS